VLTPYFLAADGAKLWRDVVATSVASLPDPALKALFSFLTAEDETFSEVLDEKGGENYAHVELLVAVF
jgi:hypothetical protein